MNFSSLSPTNLFRMMTTQDISLATSTHGELTPQDPKDPIKQVLREKETKDDNLQTTIGRNTPSDGDNEHDDDEEYNDHEIIKHLKKVLQESKQTIQKKFPDNHPNKEKILLLSMAITDLILSNEEKIITIKHKRILISPIMIDGFTQSIEDITKLNNLYKQIYNGA